MIQQLVRHCHGVREPKNSCDEGLSIEVQNQKLPEANGFHGCHIKGGAWPPACSQKKTVFADGKTLWSFQLLISELKGG